MITVRFAPLLQCCSVERLIHQDCVFGDGSDVFEAERFAGGLTSSASSCVDVSDS
jgi:hypothetical protein